MNFKQIDEKLQLCANRNSLIGHNIYVNELVFGDNTSGLMRTRYPH